LRCEGYQWASSTKGGATQVTGTQAIPSDTTGSVHEPSYSQIASTVFDPRNLRETNNANLYSSTRNGDKVCFHCGADCLVKVVSGAQNNFSATQERSSGTKYISCFYFEHFILVMSKWCSLNKKASKQQPYLI